MSSDFSKKRIILAVINDLVTDQRVHRVATTLSKWHSIKVVGRRLRDSFPLSRPYDTFRLKLLVNKGPVFYISFNLRLFFYLLFRPFDVVVANDLDTLLACYLAAKVKRKTLIYDSHEFFTELPELVHRPGTRKIWMSLEKWLLPKVKYASTVCQSIADAYAQRYNIHMEVVRNTPFYQETEEQSRQMADDTPVLIYQGSLNMGRGIENLIDAMVYLENYLLLIIGTGKIADRLYKRAEQKQLLDRIEFTGKIPFEQLHKQTCKAHLGIALEENLGLNYYYALPNKLFDYIQARIPVLVSPFPEMQRVVYQHNVGVVHNFQSPKKLARQIQEIFAYPKRYVQWQQNTHEAAKELCWENESRKLFSLYQQAGLSFNHAAQGNKEHISQRKTG
jgi:glycosyltransferase involved in cell wall biosynthesis